MLHVAIAFFGLLTAVLADPPGPEDERAYQAAAAKAGRDAGAHVRLATWCEAHGKNAERHKHLAIALEIDPDNAAARGLLGLVADKGEWRMPGTVVFEHQGDANVMATLALYHARRDKIPDTAQAHWQLAEWCDQNGLKAEATAHLTAVVRLNPSKDEAWKKLGYRQKKGQWTIAEQSTEERAESEAQRRADAKWRPLLQKWNSWIDRKTKRAEAEAALVEVHDPRAVPSIWKVFIAGRAPEQERGVRVLSQIDAPSASQALGSLAVLGATDEVRHLAATVLLQRDPREFAVFLIGLVRDPIKYEVRPVDGPGKPGELYVHGQRANQRFFYAAPPPLASLRPTDVVSLDYNGLPVATRVVGYTNQPIAAAIDPLLQGAPDLTGAPQALAKAGLGQAGAQLGARMLQNQQDNSQIGNSIGQQSVLTPLSTQVPVGQLTVMANQQAALSRSRLQEDIAALERYNNNVNQVNERTMAALETALSKKMGPERKAWVKWWNELVGGSTAAGPVPRDRGREGTQQTMVEQRAMLPAFGAETPLLTISGLQPIETIRAGDLVLTQNTASGALAFTPVLTIHRTENQVVKTITIGDTPIVATDLERFWAAGKGWVMLRDLKAGDAVRALADVARVASIEDTGARPVYHVDVAARRGIIVGKLGILAHDERMAVPAAALFDAATIDGARGPGR
jgi:hypothetical protein